MKKIAYSLAALALTAGSALAADLPARKAAPMLPPPPPPAPMWTGFYVGLNAGGTWAGSNGVNTTAFPAFPFAPLGNVGPYTLASAALASNNIGAGSGGFIGGGQIGYNWQFYNNFVVGVEADIQGIAGGSSTASAGGVLAPIANEAIVSSTTVSRSLDYIGTVRGRLGWLFTPTLLLYGTGGFAYGGVSMNSSAFQAIVGAPAVTNPWFSAGSFSDTRTGWTAGGGVEWMFMPNWSAKVEYLYYDLGRVSYASSPLFSANNAGAPFTAAFPQTSARFDGHIVRAGVNYHFNWGSAPVVAKY